MNFRNKKVKSLLLVILVILGIAQASAVFKERDFGKTIDVLCAELEQKYKEQKEIMQRYELNAKGQHQQLVATMQQIDQLSLILYSQSSEFTFDMAYACQQATDLYHNSHIAHMPFNKIMKRLDAEVERYDSLIYVLKHIAPAIIDEEPTVDASTAKGKNTKAKTTATPTVEISEPIEERTAIEIVADSIMQTQQATHANREFDRDHSANPEHHMESKNKNDIPQENALYVLNDREKEIRQLCLTYAQALRNNLVRTKNKMSADKEFYDEVNNKLKSLNSYALKKYDELQNNIFLNGGSNYFSVLASLGRNFGRINNEVKDKYGELQREGEKGRIKSQWRGPIIMMTSVFILFYIFIASILSIIILRWLLPKKFRRKASYKGKSRIIGLACGVFLFTVFITIAKSVMHHNFIVMATSITINYSWLMLVILISLLIRLNSKQINTGVLVYTPFMLMAFVVIVFRIIFIPNNMVNLIYPPLLLLFTIWQAYVIRKRKVQLPTTDVVLSILSLAAMIVGCVLAWIGYTLLAVQIMVWWSFQLACIQTIICLYDLAFMYKDKVVLKRIKNNLAAKKTNSSKNNSKKQHVNEEKQNAKLLAQAAKGDYISSTWLHDLFIKVVLPVMAVWSILMSIVFAANMFNLKQLLVKVFFYNFINQEGLLQLSLYKIVLACALFFVFYYLNYLFHSLYRNYKTKQYAKSDPSHRPNITLANNVITILVWGSYFIFVLVLFKVPKSGISLISAGLATGLGFAMKDILENFIYGLSLMSGRVRVGDYIECDGILGKVESIGYQSTQITTLDGSIIAFLNTCLFNKNFKNMTKNHSYEFVKLPIGVAYGLKVDHVRQLLEEELNKLCELTTASGRAIVQKKQGFKVYFGDFDESSINLLVAFWVLVEEKIAFVCKVKETIYNTLQENNVEIPFPQRDIYIRRVAAIDKPTTALPSPHKKSKGSKPSRSHMANIASETKDDNNQQKI